jgi:hypothetical protein
MFKSNKLLLVASLFVFSFTVLGQKGLESSYHTWTKEQALKILNSQPFSDQYQSERGVSAVAGAAVGADQNDQRIGANRGGESRTAKVLGPSPVVVRLQSSLPLRQAIVRLQELQAGYDKMDEAGKKKFDESMSSMLDCQICKNYYVITMYKFKNSAMGVVDDGLFQMAKLEDLKGKIWLETDSGGRRELEHFEPAKGSGDLAVFYFKRFDDKGSPLVTPENKLFKMVFNSDLRNSRVISHGFLMPSSFEFKVSKMIVGDQVAF